MNPLAALAVKTIGAGTAAALLSLGVAGVLAQAASPNPKPTPAATTPAKPDPHKDRRAIALTVFESEADVLHITPAQLRADLRQGQKVSDLAKDRGMTKDQFAAKLAITVKPRLETLVEKKVITQAQADKVLDRISKGYVPFWDGIHPHKATSATPTK
jgi:membrane-bound lytic murein transglycosylase B